MMVVVIEFGVNFFEGKNVLFFVDMIEVNLVIGILVEEVAVKVRNVVT